MNVKMWMKHMKRRSGWYLLGRQEIQTLQKELGIFRWYTTIEGRSIYFKHILLKVISYIYCIWIEVGKYWSFAFYSFPLEMIAVMGFHHLHVSYTTYIPDFWSFEKANDNVTELVTRFLGLWRKMQICQPVREYALKN